MKLTEDFWFEVFAEHANDDLPYRYMVYAGLSYPGRNLTTGLDITQVFEKRILTDPQCGRRIIQISKVHEFVLTHFSHSLQLDWGRSTRGLCSSSGRWEGELKQS